MAVVLPADLEQILEYIANMAKGYTSGLKWNEVAKLKSDMMKVRHRWSPDRAPVEVVRARCLELGMSLKDAATVVDLLQKAQAGRRLVPQRSYKDFKFKPPVD
jgi:hypothetical protein